jgi:hypothetical protein
MPDQAQSWMYGGIEAGLLTSVRNYSPGLSNNALNSSQCNIICCYYSIAALKCKCQELHEVDMYSILEASY